jgi:RHS repeat-associated protein
MTSNKPHHIATPRSNMFSRGNLINASHAIQRRRAMWTGVLAALLLPAAAVQAQTTSTVTRAVAFEYDTYGTLTRQTVEPGNLTFQSITDHVPNGFGLITSRTTTWQDPLTATAVSRTEGTGYDPRSRFATTSTNAKGHLETRTFDDGLGTVLTQLDANSLTTTWQYDGWGRKTRQTDPDSTATTWDYRRCIDTCLNGAVSVTITQNWFGASQTTVPTEEFSDSLGRQVLTRSWGFDGTAIHTEKVHDSLGRVQKISRPHFAAAAAVWTLYDIRDAIGRVTQIRAPNKSGSGFDTTSYSYNGLELASTNANSQTRTERRNGQGKVDRVTDARGKATGYVYDAFGNLARTTDPLGNLIVVGYDKLGRKTALADPNLGQWSYVVDPIGQTRRQTDAKSQITTFEFDPLGRMTRRLEPDLDSRWDYDTATKGVGQLGEAYTMAGTVKDYRRIHTYDSLGRASTVTASLDWDYETQFFYDGFARPERQCHNRKPKGGGTAVGNCDYPVFNAQGYVSQYYRFDGVANSLIWQGLSQDAEGHTTSEQLGNNLVTQRGYNANTGRLQSIKSGPSSTDSHQSDTYDYDALGNLLTRSQRTSTSGALLAESFTYDSLNRLFTSTLNSVVRTTLYDDLGNIVSKTGVGNYAYAPSGPASVRPHAVTGITGTVAGLVNPGFAYDANGNVMSALGRGHSWTSFNHPATIDKLSGATPVQRTAFIYNPEHERVRQTVSPVSGGVAGAATTTIWYAGRIEKEIDSAANTTTIRTELPLGLGFVEEKITGAAIAASASAMRNPRYLLQDHLGSTLAITDAAQAVLQRLGYDAWGRRRNADGTDDAGAGWGSLSNSYDHSGYTGHEHLDQLGLVHMNARLYDPILGRHTSADPTVPDAVNLQSLNRYSYVLNNALAFTDPTGLDAWNRDGKVDGIDDNGEAFIEARRYLVNSVCSFSAASGCRGDAGKQFDAMFAAVKAIVQAEQAGARGTFLAGSSMGLPQPVVTAGSRSVFVEAAQKQFADTCTSGPACSAAQTAVYEKGGVQNFDKEFALMIFGGKAVQSAVQWGRGLLAVEAVAAESAVATNSLVARELVPTLKQVLRQKAGFSAEGQAIILDENLAARGMADALRAQGHNVRSVQEIYGRGGITDPKILELARSINARVLTRDVGRQLEGGFFERAIKVDYRVRTAEGVGRILQEGLK